MKSKRYVGSMISANYTDNDLSCVAQGIWGSDRLKCLQDMVKSISALNNEENSAKINILQYLIDNYALNSHQRIPIRTSDAVDPSTTAMHIDDHHVASSPKQARIDISPELISVAPVIPTVPIGLKNLGATCYLNALVQCLYHNKLIRHSVYNIGREVKNKDMGSISSGLTGTVVELCGAVPVSVQRDPSSELDKMRKVVLALQSAFAHMQLFCAKEFNLKEFVTLLSLNTATQQDPQEFSKLFIDQLEKLNRSNISQADIDSRVGSPSSCHPTIQDYISGIESYCITCKRCNKESTKKNAFTDLDLNVSELPLSIPLPEYLSSTTTATSSVQNVNQLRDIIARHHYNEEELVGANQYACSTCKEKQDATRVTSITKYPTVLFTQIMRYVYDFESGVKRKLMTEIQYPAEMTLNQEKYQLVAVLYHKGRSAYSGHYVAEVMDWDTGDWCVLL